MDEDVLSKRFPSLMTPDKGTLDKFKTIKTNCGKVEFCLDLLSRYENTFRAIKHHHHQHRDNHTIAEDGTEESTSTPTSSIPTTQTTVTTTTTKDNSKAIKSFDKGNIYRSNGDYLNALKLYNQCLCYIEPASTTGVELIHHIYKARVAIYLDLKLYECCLENLKPLTTINFAHGWECASNNNEVAEIEAICRLGMENTHSRVSKINKTLSPSLRYRSHRNIPFIVEDLQLKYNDNYGYHLVAQRNLKPGDVIMVERPYSSVLLPSDWYLKCANCLASNHLSLIPCPGCNCAMFCSTRCRSEANLKFHCLECQIMEEIKDLLRPELMIAFRNTIRGLCVFSSIDELGELLHKPTNRRNDFDIDYNQIHEKAMFEVVVNQATNQERRTPEDLFHLSGASAIMYKLLCECTDLQNRIQTDNHRHVIMELVLRFTQIATVNSFYMSALPVMAPITSPAEVEKEFGVATYPLSSFMNHSCAPNVTKTNAGDNHEIMMVFVTRPIKAGGQIFDCYFSEVHHYKSSRALRQCTLYDQYNFSCFCPACAHNYPSHKELHRRNPSINLMHVIAENYDLEKYADNKMMVWKKFQRYCHALKNLDEQYPSKEIYVFYKCMLRCIWLLYKQAPLLYRPTRTGCKGGNTIAVAR